jgi:hypothetical protein
MLICSAVTSPTFRLVASSALLSAWLFLLMIGWTLGGAVYLLLPVSLVLFPWKSLK